MALLQSGTDVFTSDDMERLTIQVSAAWTHVADRDWAVPAASTGWSCLKTADHAIDCVYAPAFFLASRRSEGYPTAGSNLELGAAATPELLIESLTIATRILIAVVRDTPADVTAVIFNRARIVGAPPDFVPRAAIELVLHAHDVAVGLGTTFEPDRDLCRRLRDHTGHWPAWSPPWTSPPTTDDPWRDLLVASGRAPTAPA